MSAEKKQAVVDYVLGEVCDINTEKLTKTGENLNLRRIMGNSKETWAKLRDRKVLDDSDIDMITLFVKWYDYQVREENPGPKVDDVDGWREYITPDILDNFEENSVILLPRKHLLQLWSKPPVLLLLMRVHQR
jgi:hypothetical protein